jgi:hypothetical protein
MAVSGAAGGGFKWKIWYRPLKSARTGRFCNITDTNHRKDRMINVISNVVVSKKIVFACFVIARSDESS